MNTLSNKIDFQSDGFNLSGHIFTPDIGSDNNGFLFLQGWKGTQNLFTAEEVANLGFTTMTYDMRGNNESEGDPTKTTRADYVKDACAAYDHLRRQVGEKATIGLIANSFGSYVGSILTTKRNVAQISLRAPANYPDNEYERLGVFQTNVDWRNSPLGYESNIALQAIHNFKGDIQIVEAGADDIIPHQTVENYVNAVKDKTRLSYELVENAPHIMDAQLRNDYTVRVVRWIKHPF